jgi:2-polyprenyl-6-methoxyphenol hydroxylase-like FAD-dependent oxidoreductase
VEKVLEFTSTLPGWPEYMDRLIHTTPKDGIVDWKLMLRDPQTVFTSPLGRVVQVGDSAHSFLPFSGNGANQAMEDGISIASCLQIGGKSNIHWAAKVHNKLR